MRLPPIIVCPLLLLSACTTASPYLTGETMNQCMARIHADNPESAPIGLHNACLEFVSVKNGGQSEIIHPPETSNSGAVLGALAAGLLVGAAAGAAAAHPVYYAPPPQPIITTTCNQFGYQTTCTSY